MIIIGEKGNYQNQIAIRNNRTSDSSQGELQIVKGYFKSISD